jgi:hypothetical protein
MMRSELEHVIRAAGSIANDAEIVVIGSQSVLGQFPNAHVALLASAEADVYPLNYPERAELIDGSIGEGSRFHETSATSEHSRIQPSNSTLCSDLLVSRSAALRSYDGVGTGTPRSRGDDDDSDTGRGVHHHGRMHSPIANPLCARKRRPKAAISGRSFRSEPMA